MDWVIWLIGTVAFGVVSFAAFATRPLRRRFRAPPRRHGADLGG
jgi:hypothetical protein